MKLQLLIALCIISIGASAQQWKFQQGMDYRNNPLYKSRSIPFKNSPYINPPVADHIFKDSLIRPDKFYKAGTFTPGIHYALQDNMAFLVPDPKAVESMPNLWPDVKVPFTSGHMPNPALPGKKQQLKMKK